MGINPIAVLIEVSESTVYREIKRNGGHKAYNADKAQREANRRKTRLQKPRKFTHELKRKVIDLLERKWSPEQISGYLKAQGQTWVSHETIYFILYTYLLSLFMYPFVICDQEMNSTTI